MVPKTVQLPQNTEQFFSIALETFRHVDEDYQEQLPLASYVQIWSKLLLEHQHQEVSIVRLVIDRF